MSLNWVMLHPTQPFTHLPSERTHFTSSPRTSISLTTPKAYPGTSPPPLNITSSDGTIYLTNQRIVYLPKSPTPTFKSFSAPLLNLHDTHIVMPWFGPNCWTAVVQPVPGGNLGAATAGVEMKLTFKEGGAPDFQTKFEAIRERLRVVVEAARERNGGGGRVGVNGGATGRDLASVHLDELPSYQASGRDRVATPEEEVNSFLPVEEERGETRAEVVATSVSTVERVVREDPPRDAPPGYEETQQQSLQAELDRRLGQERRAWQDEERDE